MTVDTDVMTASAPEGGWVERLRVMAAALGFASLGVADVDLSDAEPGLARWLAEGFHGEMDYMARHGMTRARPAELVPGTVRAIMVSIDYTPDDPLWIDQAWANLAQSERAYVSRYALGRDYHKVVRSRLAALGAGLQREIGPFGWRAFCDSAPVLEVELAQRARSGLARQAHPDALARGRLHASSSARSTPTCPCRWMRRWMTTAGAAPHALTPAPRRPSSRPTDSMRAAACRISPSNSKVPFHWSFARRSAIGSMDVTIASSPAPGTSLRWLHRRPTLRCETGSISRHCSSCSPGTRCALNRPSKARPYAASAMSGGCATSRWRWATRPRAMQ